MKRFLILFLTLFSVSAGALANETLIRSSAFGVDFNFINAIGSADSGQPHIAGTLTYANKDSNWEFAAPFFYTQFTYDSAVCCEVHIKRIDLQLRRYFKKKQTGPYVGLVARYSDVLGRDWDITDERVSFTRKGLGVVVGFRTFVYKNLYWGTNVHFGTFFDDSRPLADGTTDFGLFGPSELVFSEFINIELLKVGLRF